MESSSGAGSVLLYRKDKNVKLFWLQQMNNVEVRKKVRGETSE